MDRKAMEPYGNALLDYYTGNSNAEILFRRDDGMEVIVPADIFFRDQDNFSSIEKEAVKLCRGHVLDIGAGTGSQSLILQNSDYRVTSIDIDFNAVTIMKRRRLKDVQCCNIFEFRGGKFDTLLMLGHGIGMVETIDGLDRFLEYAHNLIALNGQMLLDSLDVRKTTDKNNLTYLEANHKAGRYIGEIRMQCEYQDKKGPYYGWLQVDEETLKNYAELNGWKYQTIRSEKNGDYLARLVEQGTGV